MFTCIWGQFSWQFIKIKICLINLKYGHMTIKYNIIVKDQRQYNANIQFVIGISCLGTNGSKNYGISLPYQRCSGHYFQLSRSFVNLYGNHLHQYRKNHQLSHAFWSQFSNSKLIVRIITESWLFYHVMQTCIYKNARILSNQ